MWRAFPRAGELGGSQGLSAGLIWKPSEMQAGDEHHPGWDGIGWDGSCDISVAHSFSCMGTPVLFRVLARWQACRQGTKKFPFEIPGLFY